MMELSDAEVSLPSNPESNSDVEEAPVDERLPKDSRCCDADCLDRLDGMPVNIA